MRPFRVLQHIESYFASLTAAERDHILDQRFNVEPLLTKFMDATCCFRYRMISRQT
ncbi:Uncharacterised protein [Aeromonas salmonicida]|uniref:Uncharacterized protein n=1 Tax=Aeromonas salmonicida subsp. salmonicida 01-B526 TaxID=1076135 RepID=A0ABP2N2K0_AERSS|nr:hypothetical protein IYQ_07031 [Aeromonas salmonicida subsp. salmonicida 01-B526]SPT73322.1 Uncharacterised protein [Aeromonas salmonicida]SUU70624.1 Uncharacterised protein [Aeromonas salmonicida]